MDFLTETNYWGVIVVPLGLMLGFGPPLIVWLKEELLTKPSDKSKPKR